MSRNSAKEMNHCGNQNTGLIAQVQVEKCTGHIAVL